MALSSARRAAPLGAATPRRAPRCAAGASAAASPPPQGSSRAAVPAAPAAGGSRRALLRSSAAAALALLALRPAPASAVTANLRREEVLAADLVRAERALAEDVNRVRAEAEAESSRSAAAGKQLCATPFGIDVVGITEAVALLGATVGGVSARQRKIELEEVNEKLRQINISLRQQARAGVVYAPGLNYAPTGAPAEVVKAEPAAPPPPAADDETRNALREGRARLKENNGAAALVQFKKALMLTRRSGDKCLERRAMRGLAVARRAQGDRAGAIADLQSVLALSKAMGEFTGDTDALGAIADLYTELGDLERAGSYYDLYIAALQGEAATVD